MQIDQSKWVWKIRMQYINRYGYLCHDPENPSSLPLSVEIEIQSREQEYRQGTSDFDKDHGGTSLFGLLLRAAAFIAVVAILALAGGSTKTSAGTATPSNMPVTQNPATQKKTLEYRTVITLQGAEYVAKVWLDEPIALAIANPAGQQISFYRKNGTWSQDSKGTDLPNLVIKEAKKWANSKVNGK